MSRLRTTDPEYYRKKQDELKIKAIIAELQERGVKIPDEIYQIASKQKVKINFPKDGKGYYIGRNGRVFNANDKQVQFLSSNSRYLGVIAGRGSGKSAMGAQKAIQKISQGLPGAVMNPDFENFTISTWPEFREWLHPETLIPAHRYMLEPAWRPVRPFKLNFRNGAVVYCKGLKDPNSARGPNINWLWFDEPGRGDPLGSDWQIANAAVRIGRMPQAWATGTPNGKDHWLYRFFVNQEIPEEAFEEFEKANKSSGIERYLVEIIFTSIEDNKGNLDPAYYASMLAAYPEGWLRQQELYGEFVDKGGILGHREWFDGKIIPIAPAEITGILRFWDLAASEKKLVRGKKLNDPDETVGTRMSWDKTNFYIEHQEAGFWQYDTIVQKIIETAKMDGPHVRIVLEEEPGSGGINQVAAIAAEFKKELPGWPTPIGWKPIGDKVTRANVWFAEATQGKIFMVQGPWNETCLNQIGSFPVARHDDRIDSISGARFNLAPVIQWRSISFLHL